MGIFIGDFFFRVMILGVGEGVGESRLVGNYMISFGFGKSTEDL